MQLHSSLNSVLCEYHPALCWLPSTFTISVFICCVYSLSLIIFRSPNLLFSFFPHTCLWSGVLNEFAVSLSLSLSRVFCRLPVCFWKLMWPRVAPQQTAHVVYRLRDAAVLFDHHPFYSYIFFFFWSTAIFSSVPPWLSLYVCDVSK